MKIIINEESEGISYIDITKLRKDSWYIFRDGNKEYIGYLSHHELPSVYITEVKNPTNLAYIERGKTKFIQAKEIKSITIEV